MKRRGWFRSTRGVDGAVDGAVDDAVDDAVSGLALRQRREACEARAPLQVSATDCLLAVGATGYLRIALRFLARRFEAALRNRDDYRFEPDHVLRDATSVTRA